MTSSTSPYEWIFSGVGVATLSWFAAWAYRHYRKAPTRESQPENLSQVKLSGSTVVGPVAGRDINIDTFVQQGIDLDTPKDEYHSTPTAADIGTTIRQASLYLQPTVARSYDGLKVRWRAHISDIHTVRNGEASLVVKTGDEWPYVNMRVRLEDYPRLKTVHGGEPVEVTGTIDWVQENHLIYLKDVKLKFLPQ